jgi:hypothetical protein
LPRSSASCNPPVPERPPPGLAAVGLRGSRRLGLAWGAWCLALAAALAAGCQLPWPARVLAAAIPLGLARAGWRWLAGPPALQALRWLPDGRWQARQGGRWGYVMLGPPRRLGPLLWLCGSSAAGRFRLILDAPAMEPNAMRLLQARVRWPIPTRVAGRQKVSE